MRGGRVAETAMADSGELVEVLLHVFHPLLKCLEDALANAIAVTPLEVTPQGRAAYSEGPRASACVRKGETGAKVEAAPTPNTPDTSDSPSTAAAASSTVSQGVVRTCFAVTPETARDSAPLQNSVAEEDEAEGDLGKGCGDGRRVQQLLASAPAEEGLAAPRGAFDAKRRDDGRSVDSDGARTAVTALCSPDGTEPVAPCSLSHPLSPRNTTSPSLPSKSANTVEAPVSALRKRGRSPLACTWAPHLKKDAPAHTSGEHLACLAALLPGSAPAAHPFCFTVPNAVLWEAVAALAEATLIDGLCFSWLQGEVRRRMEAEQQRSEEQERSKTVPPLPSPARMLADALLCFHFPSVSIAHMRWRETAGGDRGEACSRPDGAHEPREDSSREAGVFEGLPTEVQDAVFTSVSAALMRAAAVHTAQLLNPLCLATAGDAGCEEAAETARRQEDAPPSALSQSRSHSCLAPSQVAAHAVPFHHFEAQSHLQADCGGGGEAPASCCRWQEWPQGESMAGAEGIANATRTPVTFRMVQEKLKDRHRRTLQAQQQQQQLQLILTSATVSRSPTPAPSASAAAGALRASASRRDGLPATAARSAPSDPIADGERSWRVAEERLGPLVQQAQAHDRSCFYVQPHTGGCNISARTEPAALTIANAAVRATTFTVRVLCSALASAMTGEADAATSRGSAGTEALRSVGAAGSSGTGGCGSGVTNAQSGKGIDSHGLAEDARCYLVRQWCAGLERLACTTFALPTGGSTSWRTAPRTRQSSFAVSAAALFGRLRNSSVNPQIELLADYALETGKATLALPKTSSAKDVGDGHVATAGAATAAADAVAHQLPWTTARWSVRPVVETGEADYAVDSLTSLDKGDRGHPQRVNALSSLPTDSTADTYAVRGEPSCATLDAESLREDPLKECKADTHQVAPLSPLSRPAVEWLLLSDAHGHPWQVGQAEDGQSAPTPPPLRTAQVVETSTAALFQRVLGPMLATEKSESRASADILNPLEEVGAVLATIDAVCAGRTLVDASAWRYGRNRMSVAAVSSIDLIVPESDDDGAAAGEGGDDLRRRASRPHRAHDAPEGDPAEEAVTEPPRSSGHVRLPLGLYHHECGVLHVADGATYALEVD
ncbi:hypothetical protein LSCM1_05696 [Leishmania martiniquensis]|uniref:Uncharacterized protein n=1 Tax=Leishmania martiniquensis TaxID=1580590 RepID=A0A836HIM0_9TRYP|nr:hypothetical protein LSCM1_05696 [Leishmania martiniquensis]